MTVTVKYGELVANVVVAVYTPLRVAHPAVIPVTSTQYTVEYSGVALGLGTQACVIVTGGPIPWPTPSNGKVRVVVVVVVVVVPIPVPCGGGSWRAVCHGSLRCSLR